MNGLLRSLVSILIAVSLSMATTLLATDAKGNARVEGTAKGAFTLFTTSSGGTAA